MAPSRAVALLLILGRCAAERREFENTTGWARLCAEVAAIRSDPPHFVAKLGRIYETRQVLSRSLPVLLESPLFRSSGSVKSRTYEKTARSANR